MTDATRVATLEDFFDAQFEACMAEFEIYIELAFSKQIRRDDFEIVQSIISAFAKDKLEQSISLGRYTAVFHLKDLIILFDDASVNGVIELPTATEIKNVFENFGFAMMTVSHEMRLIVTLYKRDGKYIEKTCGYELKVEN